MVRGLFIVLDCLPVLVKLLGGTTAYSAGTCWIPGHRYQDDPAGDTAAASRYLDALVGDRAPRELRETYLPVVRELVGEGFLVLD